MKKTFLGKKVAANYTPTYLEICSENTKLSVQGKFWFLD